jgi:hypothetical protein
MKKIAFVLLARDKSYALVYDLFEASTAFICLDRYEIRTNPSYTSPPSPTEMFSSSVTCRKDTSHWMGGVLSIETGGSCPVNNYFLSGFMALQLMMDITKIRVIL